MPPLKTMYSIAPLILLSISMLATACGGAATPPKTQPTTGSPRQAYHLVIDSGSSGTRFCVFPITIAAAGPKKCSVGDAAPICGKGQGGLARMSDGKSPADVPSIITPSLEEAWSKLGAAIAASGGDPTVILEKIDHAAALGTGGYRDPATAAPAKNPAWDAVWATIASFLAGKGVRNVVAMPIPGDDEAKLAWVGVKEAKAPTAPFAIIEIGGATLQLASGAPGDAYDALQAVSVYSGQDYSFKALSSERAFAACYNPEARSAQDGAACRDLIAKKVFADNRLTLAAAKVSPRAIVGLGPPWTGTLKEFPAAPPWPAKTTSDLNPAITLKDLRALADKVCPLSDAEIQAFAPNAYDATAKTGKACYALSFQAAYFGAISGASATGEISAGGDDQWARGAAVTGKFFADCN